MTKSSRLVFDLVLILAVLAFSFIPAVGTDEAHFAMASKSLRIIAAVYATIVLLGNAPRTRPLLSTTGRFLTDLGFAAFLGSMSWFETFPAGNHIREAAIYGAVGAIVAVLAIVLGRPVARDAALAR